jgi:hypothetical protein
MDTNPSPTARSQQPGSAGATAAALPAAQPPSQPQLVEPAGKGQAAAQAKPAAPPTATASQPAKLGGADAAAAVAPRGLALVVARSALGDSAMEHHSGDGRAAAGGAPHSASGRAGGGGEGRESGGTATCDGSEAASEAGSASARPSVDDGVHAHVRGQAAGAGSTAPGAALAAPPVVAAAAGGRPVSGRPQLPLAAAVRVHGLGSSVLTSAPPPPPPPGAGVPSLDLSSLRIAAAGSGEAHDGPPLASRSHYRPDHTATAGSGSGSGSGGLAAPQLRSEGAALQPSIHSPRAANAPRSSGLAAAGGPAAAAGGFPGRSPLSGTARLGSFQAGGSTEAGLLSSGEVAGGEGGEARQLPTLAASGHSHVRR